MNDIFQSLWKPLLTFLVLGLFYLINVERNISFTAEEALKWSPNRWTEEEILKAIQEEKKSPSVLTKDILPPPTGRKYIIVGGNGNSLAPKSNHVPNI